MVRSSGSMSRMRVIRARLSTNSLPSSAGVAPPTIEVLPPCGTIGAPAAAHSRTTPRQFVGGGGADHRRRAAPIEPAPVLGVGGGVRRIGQQAAFADHGADGIEQTRLRRAARYRAWAVLRRQCARPRAIAMLARWTRSIWTTSRSVNASSAARTQWTRAEITRFAARTIRSRSISTMRRRGTRCSAGWLRAGGTPRRPRCG